jgi:hypothetical protein
MNEQLKPCPFCGGTVQLNGDGRKHGRPPLKMTGGKLKRNYTLGGL